MNYDEKLIGMRGTGGDIKTQGMLIAAYSNYLEQNVLSVSDVIPHGWSGLLMQIYVLCFLHRNLNINELKFSVLGTYEENKAFDGAGYELWEWLRHDLEACERAELDMLFTVENHDTLTEKGFRIPNRIFLGKPDAKNVRETLWQTLKKYEKSAAGSKSRLARLRAKLENMFENMGIFQMCALLDLHDANRIGAVLGSAYEAIKKLEERKKGGIYYTPKHIVRYIVDHTLEPYIDDIAKELNCKDANSLMREGSVEVLERFYMRLTRLKILDPACGTGHFLTYAADKMAAYYQKLWVRVKNQNGGVFNVNTLSADKTVNLRDIDANSLPYVTRALVLNNNIYGVDIDRYALTVARIRMQISLLVTRTSCASCEACAFSDLNLNIKSGNSLVGFASWDEVPGNVRIANSKAQVFEQSERKLSGEYVKYLNNEVLGTKKILFDTLSDMQPFHWVIEFPDVFDDHDPGFDIIVGNPPYGNLMDRAMRRVVRNLLDMGGTSDIAAAFILQSGRLLKNEGRCGMIVPHRITRSGKFERIIKYLLTQMNIYEIVDSGNPFEDSVNLEMVELFFMNSREQTFCKTSSRRAPEFKGFLNKELSYKMGVLMLYFDDTLQQLFMRMMDNARTGILDGSQGRPRRADYKEDGEIICIGARDIDPYHIKVKSNRRVSMEYVKKNRLFAQLYDELLLTPNFSDRLEVALKKSGYLPDGTSVILRPRVNVDLYYLMAVLNSRLINFFLWNFILNRASLTNNISRYITRRIPVKIENVEKIARLARQVEAGRISKDVVDQEIEKLYLGELEWSISWQRYGSHSDAR